MSNIIDFLERMGQDAKLRNASDAEIDKALAKAQIAPAVRAAIFNEDQQELEKLLGATTNVCCMIQPVRDYDEAGEADRGESEISRKAVYSVSVT